MLNYDTNDFNKAWIYEKNAECVLNKKKKLQDRIFLNLAINGSSVLLQHGNVFTFF